MCLSGPKIEKPKLAPPPPSVLEQVAPGSGKSDRSVKNAGSAKYKAPQNNMSIGGVSNNTKSGIGIGS